ncbi:hypothetical protein HII30_15855 [Paenibacillus lemnae]|uniref:Uncharacterized protein n=1 Tax=Paenibacillus lemnae TaxID=1330551 RepID=A0A848MAF5_PAELE|nr:hypothetical protein [Paenibacillus lemnae]
MLSKLKLLFEDRCPECQQKLLTSHDHMSMTKHCPDHHYAEETFTQLGVTIKYKPDPQNK